MGASLSGLLDNFGGMMEPPGRIVQDRHQENMVKVATELMQHHITKEARRNKRRQDREPTDREELRRFRAIRKHYEETMDPEALIDGMQKMGTHGPGRFGQSHQAIAPQQPYHPYIRPSLPSPRPLVPPKISFEDPGLAHDPYGGLRAPLGAGAGSGPGLRPGYMSGAIDDYGDEGPGPAYGPWGPYPRPAPPNEGGSPLMGSPRGRRPGRQNRRRMGSQRPFGFPLEPRRGRQPLTNGLQDDRDIVSGMSGWSSPNPSQRGRNGPIGDV